jgi:hypothetical protein
MKVEDMRAPISVTHLGVIVFSASAREALSGKESVAGVERQCVTEPTP